MLKAKRVPQRICRLHMEGRHRLQSDARHSPPSPPSPPKGDKNARRTMLLSVGAFPFLSILPSLQQTTPPVQGDCTECVGLVDGTLGTCAGYSGGTCSSTFDDRPGYFVAPWEYPGTVLEAVEDLKQEIEALGGTIVTAQDAYIYATFADRSGEVQDDVEVYVSEADASVVLRAASRTNRFGAGGRNARRFELIRTRLGWDQVPILRNRRRKLLLFESPWDDFGPTPPPTSDYRNVDDDLL